MANAPAAADLPRMAMALAFYWEDAAVPEALPRMIELQRRTAARVVTYGAVLLGAARAARDQQPLATPKISKASRCPLSGFRPKLGQCPESGQIPDSIARDLAALASAQRLLPPSA